MASKPVQKQSRFIEYTRTFVPPSMRSAYWKYFGFPSDSSNNILTKEKIVCNLCEAVIAYNKNTSNLRTHLVAKHGDIISKIVNECSPVVTKTEPDSKNMEVSESNESIHNLEYMEADSIHLRPQQHNFTFKTDNNQTYIQLQEPESQSGRSVLITSDGLQYETFPNVYAAAAESSTFKGVEHNGSTYRIDDLIITHDRSLLPKQSSRAIVDLLVKDLISFTNVTGRGFQQTYGEIDINEIKSLLQGRYLATELDIRAHLENLSRICLFSLGLECFKNSEHYELFHIYFIYYDLHNNILTNVLYKVCEKKDFNFQRVTKDLFLNNCVAILLSDVQEFQLNIEKDIPQFQSFGSVLTQVLKKVFEQNDVAVFFKSVFDKRELLLSEDLLLPAPDVSPLCPWSKLIFLHYILANGDFSKNLGTLDQTELQEFCEYILPFKITFETINDEQLPLCSIIRPLISKLINDHFTVYGRNNRLINQIEPIIVDELNKSVMNVSFLKEATFFDGRFQHSVDDEEESSRESLQISVIQKFSHILETIMYTEFPILKEEDNVSSSSRRSSLKSLFNRISDTSVNSPKKKIKISKTNIDVEFERYKVEPPLDLEHCPLEWWKSNDIKYSELSKVARLYLSVPCCIIKLDCNNPIENMAISSKRFVLRQNSVERYLWYLYFNQEFCDRIRNM